MKKTSLLLFFLSSILFISCSDTIVIENVPDSTPLAPPISGYFKKRVLIEDYTGTWCGNCTRVAQAIEKVELRTDKAVSVGIHDGSDPYRFSGIRALNDLILPGDPMALPISRLNRLTIWTTPENANIEEPILLTSNNTNLGLAMSSTVSGGNINLDVKIKFAQDYNNLKLVVYLVEDKLIYDQRNYTSDYYGGISPIPNYEHNHVLRNSLTNILGDVITGTTNGSTVTKNFSIPVPSNVFNHQNIGFVAFVVSSDNNALNVRASHANESQAFEENP